MFGGLQESRWGTYGHSGCSGRRGPRSLRGHGSDRLGPRADRRRLWVSSAKGVILVHELGQRRRAEELLDGGDHRTDIDESLRSDDALVLALQGHPLTDDALHAGERRAELVLQQLTDAAQTAVAQMVDVIGGTDAVPRPFR